MNRLGKYELLERLAIGGMAELFKARLLGDHGFKKTVVIKKILPQLAANSTFVNMFVDEARITALLDHPNIVQVFEFGQEGDELYLVMQLVDGSDLFDLMGKTKTLDTHMPIELAVYVTCEILDALDYAHNARDDRDQHLGIVHRDISPGNVLISSRGNVMLTDFGIAWAYERHQKTEAGKLKGKFGYMSPEQVAGEVLDARSDLFSTGILLAEMLINRHLFVGQSDLEILLMVRDADLTRLLRHGTHIPTDLMAIVHQALAPKPARRFQTALAFREALAEWLFTHHKRVSSRDLASYIDTLSDTVQARAGEHARGTAERTPMPVDRSRDESADKSGAQSVERPVDMGEVVDPRREITGPRAERDGRVARGSRPGSRGHDWDQDESTAATSAADPLDPGATMPIAAMRSSRPSLRISQSLLEAPSETGDFFIRSPMSLLHALATRGATGLLTVERDDVSKEAYFKDGSPQFVGSNVPSERLGQYLLAHGLVSQAELDQALEVLEHFDGHLLDSLISRGVLEPLEALRHLSGQVSAKLLDVCLWQSGSYRWYDGRNAPRRARRLQLDTYEILGAAVTRMDIPRIVEWAKTVRHHHVHQRFKNRDLTRFGLGDAMMRARVLLENHSATVTNLAGRIHDPTARLAFVRALYLLIHCDLAVLEAPA